MHALQFHVVGSRLRPIAVHVEKSSASVRCDLPGIGEVVLVMRFYAGRPHLDRFAMRWQSVGAHVVDVRSQRYLDQPDRASDQGDAILHLTPVLLVHFHATDLVSYIAVPVRL